MVLALRPARSALWADALKPLPAELPDFAPRLSTERAKPSVEHLLGRLNDFERHTLYRSDPIAASALSFGV